MAQRIVLSREQVRKLRQLRGEVDLVPDGDVPNRDAKLEIQAPALEDTRPYEVLTHGSIANRIRRRWGFER
jgi:DNA primase